MYKELCLMGDSFACGKVLINKQKKRNNILKKICELGDKSACKEIKKRIRDKKKN